MSDGCKIVRVAIGHEVNEWLKARAKANSRNRLGEITEILKEAMRRDQATSLTFSRPVPLPVPGFPGATGVASILGQAHAGPILERRELMGYSVAEQDRMMREENEEADE